MIVRCESCKLFFDDAFRLTYCPHETFAANDGDNNFAHHPESYLSVVDADLCNVLPEQSDGSSFWRRVHHIVAHPLLGASGGAPWAWRFHDWTLPKSYPGKIPIPKRPGLK